MEGVDGAVDESLASTREAVTTSLLGESQLSSSACDKPLGSDERGSFEGVSVCDGKFPFDGVVLFSVSDTVPFVGVATIPFSEELPFTEEITLS